MAETSSRVEAPGSSVDRQLTDRLAAAFVLVLLGASTLLFWVGIPLGGLWLLSHLTESWNGHFLLSLVLIPAAMVLFAPALGWLNGLYLRVTGVLDSDDQDAESARRFRGPLEPLLFAGMAVAVGAFFVWFLFFAENPIVR